MLSILSRCRFVGLALIAVAAVLIPTGQANASVVDGVNLLSSTEKTVVVDQETGRVLSASTGRTISTLISNHNICNSGDGCYYSGRVPYANQGFYGTAGTYSGNWPYRSGWYTGRYTARACWVQACAQQAFGPYTTVTFNGSLVTGTSFRIY